MTDVVIAGAGPAGSVAARLLAEAGLSVVLCDRRAFPRDKACGDGLIADSQHALKALGVADHINAHARHSNRFVLYSPNGTPIELTGRFSVVPRRILDAILFERAQSAGALYQRVIVDGPILSDDDRVVGLIGRDPVSGRPVEHRASLTILATGANGASLAHFDPEARPTASGFAIRAYAEHTDGRPPLDHFVATVDNKLPGYAWAFPAPGNLVNIGVGVFRGARLREIDVNLGGYLKTMLAGDGALGRIVGPLRAVEKPIGAPLRTSLEGTGRARSGLAIIGEAAGTTYALSGEGIGKAIESAMLLARIVTRKDRPLANMAGLELQQTMRTEHGARFRSYAVAERWIAYPFVADYVARRAVKARGSATNCRACSMRRSRRRRSLSRCARSGIC